MMCYSIFEGVREAMDRLSFTGPACLTSCILVHYTVCLSLCLILCHISFHLTSYILYHLFCIIYHAIYQKFFWCDIAYLCIIQHHLHMHNNTKSLFQRIIYIKKLKFLFMFLLTSCSILHLLNFLSRKIKKKIKSKLQKRYLPSPFLKGSFLYLTLLTSV